MLIIKDRNLRSFVLFAVMATMFLWPERASAVPSFAKNFNTECSLCHTAWPKLNEFGIRFRANGYRMEGDEGTFIWDKPVPIGLVAHFIYENEKQEAVAAEAGAHVEEAIVADEHNEEADEHNERNLRALAQEGEHDEEGEENHGSEEGASSKITEAKLSKFDLQYLLLYSAGSLAPHVSYLAHLLSAGDSTSVELANVWFMDILPNAALNFRVGKMSADLPYLSSARRITHSDYLMQFQPAVGGHAHGSVVTSGVSVTNVGLELNGLKDINENAYIEYAVGMGNDGVEASEDNVGAYYGYLTLNYAGQNLGFIYRTNRVGETESAQQNTNGYAVAIDLNYSSLNLTGAYAVYNEDSLVGADLEKTSATVDALYEINPSWFLNGRYDFIDTMDSKEESKQYIAGIAYYMPTNVRMQLEYVKRTDTNHDGVDLDFSAFYGEVTIGF